MKEFFGIDVTGNKNNDALNCCGFLSRQPSPAHSAALSSAVSALEEQKKKAGLPMLFQVLYLIVYLGSISMLIGMIRGIGNVGFSKAYENAPVLFYVAAVFLVLWAGMAVWKHGRSKRVSSSEKFESAVRRADTAAAACLSAMGVPEHAPKVDVLSCRYTVRKGKITYVSAGTARYANPELRIFTEDNVLFLADVNGCYAIPFCQIRCLRKVSKAVMIAGWNKELGPREGRYKAYKLSTNQYGNVSVKPYYVLEITRDNEDYALSFPCYELPVFEAFLKLPVTE